MDTWSRCTEIFSKSWMCSKNKVLSRKLFPPSSWWTQNGYVLSLRAFKATPECRFCLLATYQHVHDCAPLDASSCMWHNKYSSMTNWNQHQIFTSAECICFVVLKWHYTAKKKLSDSSLYLILFCHLLRYTAYATTTPP